MEILVPIFVCVILPVSIVWIIGRVKHTKMGTKISMMTFFNFS